MKIRARASSLVQAEQEGKFSPEGVRYEMRVG